MCKNKKGFTLAEALTMLTILGVLAAITVPVVFANYQNHAFAVSQKAFGVDVGSALKLLMVEKGRINMSANAQNFIQGPLQDYLKISEVCELDGVNIKKLVNSNTSSSQCGWVNAKTYKPFDAVGGYGAEYITQYGKGFARASNATVAAAKLANGTAMLLYYNPNCAENPDIRNNRRDLNNIFNATCLNIIYDVNGPSGPNQAGIDVGTFSVFFPKKSVMSAPVLSDEGVTDVTKANYEAAANFCDSIRGGTLGLPSYEEVLGILLNQEISGLGGLGITPDNGDFPIMDSKRSEDVNKVQILCVRKK